MKKLLLLAVVLMLGGCTLFGSDGQDGAVSDALIEEAKQKVMTEIALTEQGEPGSPAEETPVPVDPGDLRLSEMQVAVLKMVQENLKANIVTVDEVTFINMILSENVMEIEVRTVSGTENNQPEISYSIIAWFVEAYMGNWDDTLFNAPSGDDFSILLVSYAPESTQRYQSKTRLRFLKRFYQHPLTLDEWVMASNAGYTVEPAGRITDTVEAELTANFAEVEEVTFINLFASSLRMEVRTAPGTEANQAQISYDIIQWFVTNYMVVRNAESPEWFTEKEEFTITLVTFAADSEKKFQSETHMDVLLQFMENPLSLEAWMAVSGASYQE